MKQNTHAGKTGKGFYAALTLSAAMVGAACWYAYSEAGKLTPPAAPEHQYTAPRTAQTTAPAVTTALPATKYTAPPRTETVTQTQTDTQAAEAAAILSRSIPEAAETDPPAPAETEAPVEQPVPPVGGEVLMRFSQGELVKSSTTGIWSTHNGTDFAAAIGEEVRCTEDGTVTGVSRDALLGICVTVLHENGTVTRYCGLNEGLNVQAGDVIARGTVIGAVGDTNESENSMAPHLHFEVQQNDKYLDPESYLACAEQKAGTETEPAA